ncbi:MAG: DNA polymerase III subunit alpha [Myxococcales bacterium]|nr:DNA polymerase III subunit alpha [Myxococcales bacterium]USN49795.1 MAG: DNA polymerase III subunit alpha [Myxococcales bacterium]
MNKDFTHLHLHTQYSFLDGAIRIKDLISKVNELGMKQVAVTDHGNMYGALDFYKQAKNAGVKPIIGIEAYVTGSADYTEKVRENFHLVLLAENDVGYRNLRKLSSEAFVNGKYFFPRIDKKLLYKHREGLIASTACLGGEVSKKCAHNDIDGARKAVQEFKHIFGPNNFFLEVQPNGIPIQERVNGHLAQLAKDEGLRIVATNDCHYVTRDQHDAQNILMAIRQQKAWDDPTLHKHETDAFYIRSHDEMYELLKNDYPDAFANACEIGRRCNVNIELGKTYLPPFPCPDNYRDEEDYLRHLSHQGLMRRLKEINYPIDIDHYTSRLETELSVIIGMGFPGYFLIVQDFINWAKNHEIKVGPGRGSGAGSLVAWALRITDIDPIPYNLLFERFLNPERVSMPDFDIDFMQERRGEVINYVADRYGRERVGQIATYSALNPKSAVKDVARTLGIPFAEINELTKPMPLLIEGKKPDLKQALEYAPNLKAKAKTDPLYERVLENARVLEGLYRQAGMHAGGIVIGEKDLVEYVPIFSGANGEIITQFDKDKVEEAGLVKFDFLGLKTLDVIAHAEKMVNRRIDEENKLDHAKRREKLKNHPHAVQDSESIPYLVVELLAPERKEVFELIASGDTLGVFQIESGGFQDMCRKLKPDCFEDIIAAGALYRPGPMQSGMVDDFIERKHGRKAVVYPHPMLEPVLKPTYGTIVYQEQVLQSAQVLAGYTLGAADILRRAMGKKKFEEMEKQRASFIAGAQKNGVAAEKAAQVFDTIEKFAGYGFNKSHSAAYALITYQTAYLKRFYPVEFMAALLTTSSGSTEDVVKYIREARAQGIKVLPPDINISTSDFTVDYEVEVSGKNSYGQIRFGLGAVKGLGQAALDSIIEARNQKGPAQSMYQFCQNVAQSKVNKKVLEALIKSGAFDCFSRPRKQLMLSIDKAISQAQRIQRDHNRGQTSMFDMFSSSSSEESIEEYANVGEYVLKDRLLMEKEAVGFYLSGHPLDPYEKDAKDLGAIPTVQLVSARHLEEVSVVGVVSALKERPLKSGKGRWAVVVIEDSFGQAELLCFSTAYEQAENLLKTKEPLIFSGRALIDDVDDEGQQQKPKMRLSEVRLLSEAQISRCSYLDIDLRKSEVDENTLHQIEKLLSQFPGEKSVRLHMRVNNKIELKINLSNKFAVNPEEQVMLLLEQEISYLKVRRT